MNRRTSQYEFGSFRLNAAEALLLRDGVQVALTPRVFDVLLLLVENSGRLISKDEIMQHVWPDAIVEEANLTVSIHTLRKALGEAGARYVQTVPKRGYRFTARVRVIDDEEFADAKQSRLAAAERTPARKATGEIAIAVLPFADLTGELQNEYLSDGLAESIINALSPLPGLRVMARNTVFRYKEQEPNARQVGRELGVHAVVVGRILWLNDEMVVRAEMVDASDGAQLWSGQARFSPSDIFAAQEKIANEVADKLRLHFSSEMSWQISQRQPASVAAYDLYLKGRYFWNKFLESDLWKALGYFARATEADPHYAPAYSGIASSYALLGLITFPDRPPQEYFPLARGAAIKALEIDETLAEAHAVQALTAMSCEWNWKKAELAFQRAIELNPNNAMTHEWHYFLLAATGRVNEGVAAVKRALSVDPFSLSVNFTFAFALHTAGHYTESQEQCLKMLEMDAHFFPAWWGLAIVHMQQGMHQESIAAARKAVTISRGHPHAFITLAYALAAAGEREEALAVLRKLQRLTTKQYISPHYFALIYARLGEADRAFEQLYQASENHDFWAFWLVEPGLDVLRSDPRFAHLLQRVGLAPYSRRLMSLGAENN